VGELFGFDADAGVYYFKLDDEVAGGRRGGFGGLRGERNQDADLSFLRKLYGVANQVDQYLTEAEAVRDDMFGDVSFDVAMQENSGFQGTAYKNFQYFFDAAAEIGLFFFQGDRTGLQRREIQNIINDGEQGVAATPDRVDISALFFVEGCLVEKRSHADDAIHRRAYLVAHIGEE